MNNMSIRLKMSTDLKNAHATQKPEYEDSSRDQRETTVDGYTFHWGPNEIRNFLDDGVGLAHAAFKDADSDGIYANTVPFNNARS